MKATANQKAIIMLVILVISIIISTVVTESRELPISENKLIAGNNEAGFVEIGVADYLVMKETDNLRVIHIGSPNCTWSKQLEPYLEEISEDYGITIYYINIDDFTDEEEETFTNSHEALKEEYGTPTLIVVGKGDIKGKFGGYTENKDAYIDFFKEHDLIK